MRGTLLCKLEIGQQNTGNPTAEVLVPDLQNAVDVSRIASEPPGVDLRRDWKSAVTDRARAGARLVC